MFNEISAYTLNNHAMKWSEFNSILFYAHELFRKILRQKLLIFRKKQPKRVNHRLHKNACRTDGFKCIANHATRNRFPSRTHPLVGQKFPKVIVRWN